MRIFFYKEILRNPDIAEFNQRAVRKHKLSQLYQYFADIIERLADFATDDPDLADYFFVPLFIAAWQYENTDPEEFKLISDTCRFLDRGRHILIGTGDFGQRYHSKTEMQSHPIRAYRDKYRWLDDRIVLIALESTDELHPQDVPFFPYMTEPLRPDPRVSRSLLCSFKGALGYPELPDHHIRGAQLITHAPQLNREGLHILGSDDTSELGRLSTREMAQRSIFTLCPAGYGQWSFRLFEALMAGSIPVMLSDSYRLPFEKFIQWNKYVLRFPESKLPQLAALLKSVDRNAIEERQKNILNDAALFQKDHCLELISRSLQDRAKSESAHCADTNQRPTAAAGLKAVIVQDLAAANGGGQLRALKSDSKHSIFFTHRHAIEKLNYESSIEAEDLYVKGRKPGLLRIVVAPTWAFIKAYLLRGNILYGVDGLVRSYVYAFARLVRIAKAREQFQKEEYRHRRVKRGTR